MAPVDEADFLISPPIVSSAGVEDEADPLLLPLPQGDPPLFCSSDDLYSTIIQQNEVGLSITRSEQSLFGSDSAIWDYSTSPNTFLEPDTPSLNDYSPWSATNRRGDASGGSAPSLTHFQSSQLSFDADLFGVGTGYISPQQLNLDVALSSYPPLPELDGLPQDPMHDMKGSQIGHPTSYLPAGSLAEAVPSWLDEDQPRGQILWNAEAAKTESTQATSMTMTTGTPLLMRGGLRDTSKDEYLIRCKEQGMSYKQIKESGGFDEAESTLRGRYRALTKPREARLRKPEWGPREIDLLFEGVAHCSKSNTGNLQFNNDLDAVTIGQFVNKVPWKQVAEYMEGRGAYRYGNATVKKKYLEILKERGAVVRMD